MSLRDLFKRKEVENPVHTALLNGLDEMKKHNVDRITLTIQETEPRETSAMWVTSPHERYYPLEILTDEEQEMIKAGKHYESAALVLENVGGMVTYPNNGLERVQRTSRVPVLCPMEEKDYIYDTEGGIITKESLKSFADLAQSRGCTPEMINQRVQEGIQEYHDKTSELMEQAGVYETLERMEQRVH